MAEADSPLGSPVTEDITSRELIDARLEETKLGGGWLGKVFGVVPNIASRNITGLITLSVLVIASLLSHGKLTSEQVDLWKIFIPIITLSLGYLFGSR